MAKKWQIRTAASIILVADILGRIRHTVALDRVPQDAIQRILIRRIAIVEVHHRRQLCELQHSPLSWSSGLFISSSGILFGTTLYGVLSGSLWKQKRMGVADRSS